MRLCVVRHGKAEPGSPTGRDQDRPLRERGVRQADYIGLRLEGMDRPPTLVVASPYVRAFDTGERIAGALGARFVTDDRLRVGEAVSGVLALIGEHAGVEGLCLVGHNPQLEHLCGVLLTGPTAPPIRVRTGEAFVFELDASSPGARGALFDSLRLDD